jgi:hypothetical protein
MTHPEHEPRAEAGKFKIDASDETFTFRTLGFDDPIVTAAQIAEAFGAHPLAQFRVLQQLASGEIESKRPTETADLRGDGQERFFVIRGDRGFGFSVDGLSLEWPLPLLPGDHLRELARVDDGHDLVQVTPAGFIPVEGEDPVRLAGAAAEEFRIVPRSPTVTVFYREEPFVVERRQWITEELLALFAVPAGHKLDVIEGDDEFKELKPGKKIKVRDGMHFTSHVPAGQSS